MRRVFIPVLVAALSSLAIGSAAADSVADAAWVAKCMAQLKEEHADARTRRLYCVCMHGFFEDNQPVTQTGMERMYPPAHRLCRQEAGWK